MGLREAKREQLIDRILATTCELIEEVGYEAAQVEEIARRLEISKPTFYRYFASKDDVLAEYQLRLTELWASEVEAKLANELGAEVSVADQLYDLARLSTRDLLENEVLARAVYLNTGAVPSERVRAVEERAERSLTRLLSAAQERGEISCRFPAELLALIVESVFVAVGYAWAIREIESRELEGALELALTACLEGFLHANRKHRQKR